MFSYKFSNTSLLDKILFILVVILVAFFGVKLWGYYTHGVDTIWDEGFYMMWLDNNDKETQFTQSFQIIDLFFSSIKHNLFEFRIVTLLIKIFLTSLFLLTLHYTFKKKEYKLNYLDYGLIFLAFVPSFFINSKVLSYREIQQFSILFSWVICFNINLNYNFFKKVVFYILLSLFHIIACVNIAPSGVLNFILCFSFLIFGLKINRKEFGIITIGFIIAFGFYILTVSNLVLNLSKILENGKILSQSDNKYSLKGVFMYYNPLLISFKLKFFIPLIILFVASFIKNKIVIRTLIIATLLYEITLFSFCVELFILPFYLFFDSKIVGAYQFKKEYLFLTLIPFLSIFGSAIPPSLNLYYFIPIWIVFCVLLSKHISAFSRYTLYLFTIIFIVQSYFKINIEFEKFLGNAINSKEQLSFQTNLSGVKITKDQKRYFTQVNRVLKKTKFDSKNDLFFTMNYDLLTVYVFNGKLNSQPYHRLKVYLLDRKAKRSFKVPKYIILDQLGINVISKNNEWDFPKRYEKYDLGCPDVSRTDRFLFCRK